MPLQATSGAASYDAFGGGVPVEPVYIEQIFSTYLYTGNGSTQTITNGIDLSTKGGLVWIKDRSATTSHGLFDTARGVNNYLSSNSANEQNVFGVVTNALTAFNSNGFSVGTSLGWLNASGDNIASWTFRKQPKFFDVVTYTGNGINNRVISHSLGSVPGCIIFKATNTTSDWIVYHRSLYQDFAADNVDILKLNSTAAQTGVNAVINDVSATTFTLGNNVASNAPNIDGATYVAYLFAHDAGGFGLTGTDNVISCGSWYNSGSAPVNVTLGYEPQWILIKKTDSAQNWFLVDTMRGDSLTAQNLLKPNLSDAENVNAGAPGYPAPTATGFTTYLGAEGTFIYIAIRRGPMKVPTSGTSVFNPVLRTGTSAAANVSTGNTPDWVIIKQQLGSSGNAYSRLQGPNRQFYTEGPTLEVDQGVGYGVTSFLNTSFNLGLDANAENQSGRSLINWTFSRAPSFFDQVCYTGTGSATTQAHNLGVVPELVIWKRRSSTADWRVWQSSFSVNDGVYINSTLAKDTDSTVQTAIPTSTVLNLSTGAYTNASGSTYTAFLFATAAGVSKVGSYTGNGSTQTIDCGFGASGARFVLIKRADSTGGWYVYDTARGMTVLTDPYLFLNSTAADAATLGSVTTVSTGFALNSSVLAAINVSGGTYIFLAIA